jgi:hypothetical protein
MLDSSFILLLRAGAQHAARDAPYSIGTRNE